ncbi:MAG: hypothetical protein Q9163_003972 [Psora crenata]
MSEAKEGHSLLEHIDEGTFVRFLQYAYTGDYKIADEESVPDSSTISTSLQGDSERALTRIAPQPSQGGWPISPFGPTSLGGADQPSQAARPTGLFGGASPGGAPQPSQAARPTGLFGAPQPSQGGWPISPFVQTSLGGAPQPSQAARPTCLFGATQPSQAARPTGLFGAPQPSQAARPTGLFGGPQPSQAARPTGLFGGPQPSQGDWPISPFGQTSPGGADQPSQGPWSTQSAHTERFYAKSAPPCQAEKSRNHCANDIEVLLCHARLYVFADQYIISPLKSLTLSKLRDTLSNSGISGQTSEAIIELVRYCYSNTSDRPGSMDEMRQLIIQYIAYELEVLGRNAEFLSILEEHGSLGRDLVVQMLRKLD